MLEDNDENVGVVIALINDWLGHNVIGECGDLDVEDCAAEIVSVLSTPDPRTISS